MPITAENYDAAVSVLRSGKGSPELLKRLQSQVNEYVNSNQYGPPLPPATPHQPTRTDVGGYFYNPSLEDFRTAFSDSNIRQQLGLEASDEKDSDIVYYNRNTINSLGEDSPEYKRYVDYAFEQAKQRDPNLIRYDDLSLRDNPFDVLKGGLVHLAGGLLGADKTLTGGMAPRAVAEAMVSDPPEPGGRAARIGRPMQAQSQTAADQAAKQNVLDAAETIERVAPVSTGAGQFVAYGAGFAPANIMQKAGENVLNYVERGALGKAITAGTVAGATNAAESAAQRAIAGDDISFSELGTDAAIGLGLGSPLDLASQGIGKIRGNLRNTPSGRSLKTAEEGGARTGVIGGLVLPENIRESVAKAGEYGSTRHAVDFATEKIAPQMAENISNRTQASQQKAAGALEAYTASPAGLQRRGMRPVAEGIVDLVKQATRKLPSGAPGAINPRTIASAKQELKQMSEMKMVPLNEVDSYLKSNPNSFRLDDDQIGLYGGKPQQGMVPIVDVADMDARELIALENRINEEKKYATKEGGIDVPTLDIIEQRLKQVRDRYKDYTTPPSVVPEAVYQGAERRQQGRPTDSEWERMSPRERAQVPLSEPPEAITAPPGSIIDAPVSSIAPENTSVIQKQKKQKFARDDQYQKDIESMSNEFSVGSEARAADNARALKLQEELDRLGISQEFPNRTFDEPPRADDEELVNAGFWNAYHDKRFQDEINPENIAAKQRAEAAKRGSVVEDIPAEEYQSIGPSLKAEASQKSILPNVPDQVGSVNKENLAQEYATPDVPKVKEIIKQTDNLANNLTPEELNAIKDYTSSKGTKVGSPEWNSAIQKLKIENPTKAGALYHGTRLPQEQIDKILSNGIFDVNKPISTSYNQGVSSAMAYSRANRGEPVIFKVSNASKGHSLASKKLGINNTSGEREILLTEGSFKVGKSYKDSDGNLVIELSEQPRDVNIAYLDDGTRVTGLSALQRQHHLSALANREAAMLTQADNPENMTRQLQSFNSGPGRGLRDDALLAEARAMGMEPQLREVAATREAQNLHNKMTSGGYLDRLATAGLLRLDPIASAIAGAAPNPFAPMPTPTDRIRQYMFELLNQRAGKGAARFGNELSDSISEPASNYLWPENPEDETRRY